MKKIVALLFTLTLLQGCHHGGNANNQSTVRLVNGTAASLDMYWSGNSSASAVASGVVYGAASSGVTINDGVSTIELAPNGGTPTGGANFAFGGGYSYTMLAYPSYSSGLNGPLSNLQVAQLIDNQIVPATGNALIGVADYAGAGSLDVYILAGSSTPTPPVYPWASNISGLTNYATLPVTTTTGTTSYHIQVTGAGAGYNNDVRLDIPVTVANPINIGNQQILTLVLTPTSGGSLVDGLVVFQQNQTLLAGQRTVTSYKNGSARVRVAASFVAAGSPLTAVTANGISILSSNLNSGNVSSYVTVPLTGGSVQAAPQGTGVSLGAQSLPIALSVNGSPVSVSASCTNATALPGQDLTLLAVGTASSPQCYVLTDDNTLASSGYAKVRLVNGVNGLTGSVSLSYNGTQSVPAIGAVFGVASTAANELVNINNAAILDVLFGGTNYAASTTYQVSPSPMLQPQGVYSVFVLGNSSAASAVLSTDHLY